MHVCSEHTKSKRKKEHLVEVGKCEYSKGDNWMTNIWESSTPEAEKCTDRSTQSLRGVASDIGEIAL